MFNLNRALLIAGVRLGIPEALEMFPRPSALTTMIPPPGRYRGKGAPGSRDRLHPGRSSSVRKLQRWLDNGDIVEAQPDEKAKLRHAWYRIEKACEAYRASLASLPEENRL